MPNNEALISSRETADRLKISRSTLVRRVREGAITPSWQGTDGNRVMLFNPVDVEALAATQSTPAVADGGDAA